MNAIEGKFTKKEGREKKQETRLLYIREREREILFANISSFFQ